MNRYTEHVLLRARQDLEEFAARISPRVDPDITQAIMELDEQLAEGRDNV